MAPYSKLGLPSPFLRRSGAPRIVPICSNRFSVAVPGEVPLRVPQVDRNGRQGRGRQRDLLGKMRGTIQANCPGLRPDPVPGGRLVSHQMRPGRQLHPLPGGKRRGGLAVYFDPQRRRLHECRFLGWGLVGKRDPARNGVPADPGRRRRQSCFNCRVQTRYRL